MLLGFVGRASARLLSRVFTPASTRFFHRTPTRMVEGHQCHRVAHAHRKQLLNRTFVATSPNGRFADGAAAITGQPLTRIECHGKCLFYFFGPVEAPVVLHFHFGMAGAFATMAPPGREPTATTRLRLVDTESGLIGHLSAMTVLHGGLDFYHKKVSQLGEDPLRSDADPEAVWAKVSVSKKPIGLLLMDQSVIAGVGNIYRAEILFVTGVHPEQPGCTLTRPVFDAVWAQCVALMQRGFVTGSILTVDPAEAAVLGPPWTRRYIYNHSRCGRCGGAVRSWDMAARTVYCCEGCQRLPAGAELAAGRAKALAAAAAAKVFVSHCAPDDAAATGPGKMTVPALQAALRALGLETSGRKADLVARLQAAQAAAASVAPAEEGEGVKKAEEAGPSGGAGAGAGTPLPKTPTARPRGQGRGARAGAGAATAAPKAEAEVFPEVYAWDQAGGAEEAPAPAKQQQRKRRGGAAGLAGASGVASAEAAAREKVAAGEGRNVEHVALVDDASAALAAPSRRSRPRR